MPQIKPLASSRSAPEPRDPKERVDQANAAARAAEPQWLMCAQRFYNLLCLALAGNSVEFLF